VSPRQAAARPPTDGRRRLKELRDPAYTLSEAERAAGLGVDNKQRGVEELVKRVEGMNGIEEIEA
jgi:bud site selection protein 20